MANNRTYGEIHWKPIKARRGSDKPGWSIKAEPHVAIRLKRVFARVQKAAAATLELIDTPETCRELLWFLERYPMAMSGPDRKRLEDRGAAHVEQEQRVFTALTEGYEAPPVELALPPRDYQRVGIDLTLRSGGLLIADEMGLGKTVQAIGLTSDPRALPMLVVTLTHLPRQWAREFQKFAPKLEVYLPKTCNPNELEKVQARFPCFRRPDVYVMNYHKLAGWAPYLAGKVQAIVFDEIQELRHSDSEKYASASAIAEQCQIRQGLSGTPIYNYGGEFYNVLNILAPDAMGSHDEFAREWCTGTKGTVKHPKAFGAYLRDSGLMIRRTRAMVGRELPPLTTIPHDIEADLDVLDRVDDQASELARVILAQNPVARGAKFKAAEELSWMLRQATGIAKARYAADFVRILVESGEPVLMFGWHRECYGIWAERLKDLSPQFYTGSETPHQKATALANFIDGESNLLVMSLRAGAGVDGLQARCRTVVFAELDFCDGVHRQCIGRVFRDSQQDPVMAYFLLADHGSDPVVADILGIKRQQLDGAIDPDAELVEQLQMDENHVKRLAQQYLKTREPLEQLA